MKKFLLFVCYLGLANFVSAQERVGFGFQAGWSSSHISGDTFDSKNGFIGGLTATVPVIDNFYIQPEVNFQQLGGKYKEDAFIVGDVVYRYVQLNTSYLQIPVLVKYRFGSTHLAVYAGPQLGFRLKAEDQLDDGNSFDSNNIKSKDFVGVYGLEYFVRLPDEAVALVVNARYMTGFTNFAHYTYVNMPEDSYKNNAFMVTVGLRF